MTNFSICQVRQSKFSLCKMYSEGNIKEILPFFPHYTVELLFNDHLKIIWFESGFSQSRYNFENKNTGSNACTLIAVLMAIQCNVNNLGVSQTISINKLIQTSRFIKVKRTRRTDQ